MVGTYYMISAQMDWTSWKQVDPELRKEATDEFVAYLR